MPDTAPDSLPEGPSRSHRPVDGPALRHVLGRLRRASRPPWLHGEVARRMAERLPIVRLQPDAVIDWWSASGASDELLAQAYPRARRVAVEADEPTRLASERRLVRPWWSPQRWTAGAAEVRTESALASGAGQLLWANMMLHMAADPHAVMAQWHRALAVDGFLMFSTLGPGSLNSLSELYRAQGWPPPFAPFVDMHDLGDMLVQAGFADPVMDQEQITLTWASADALLAELRTLGGNMAQTRFAGLRTPRWRERLVEVLTDAASTDCRLKLTFELVYGHAFRPPPRPRLAEQTNVPLADMRAMVRAGRPRHG
jgi:malonyl-CoA O-methyltransferase